MFHGLLDLDKDVSVLRYASDYGKLKRNHGGPQGTVSVIMNVLDDGDSPKFRSITVKQPPREVRDARSIVLGKAIVLSRTDESKPTAAACSAHEASSISELGIPVHVLQAPCSKFGTPPISRCSVLSKERMVCLEAYGDGIYPEKG